MGLNSLSGSNEESWTFNEEGRKLIQGVEPRGLNAGKGLSPTWSLVL